MSIYNKSGIELNACFGSDGIAKTLAYDYGGNIVWMLGNKETDYSQPSISAFKTISIQNCQGIDIYNNVLFQFRGNASSDPNDMVSFYNFETGDPIALDMTIDSGHGNAVAFSKDFYSASDSYPIIYCGDWFNPIVHVNRITIYGSTHLYDIVMDVNDTGYYMNPAIDFDNEIMYTVGYKQQSTSSSTNNYCIVCKWDISDMTDNGNGTFTPTLISTYDRAYIYIMQDLKFNDGYVWITAGGHDNPEYLYAMNPATGEFDYSITMPITTEIEGLSWQIDYQTGLWFAYIGFQGGIYYKIVFPELEVTT